MLIAHGAERSHDPTITVAALPHVSRRGSVYIEPGIFKDLLELNCQHGIRLMVTRNEIQGYER